MEYLALISTSKPEIIQNKKLSWGTNYVQMISKFFPKEKINLNNLKYGYIYFINSSIGQNNLNNSSKPFYIEIKAINITNKFLSLEFEFSKELDYSSDLIKKIARKYLKRQYNISSNELIPFFLLVKKTEFEELLENEKIKALIEIYFQKRNWLEISKLLEPHEHIESNDIWFDVDGLSKAGFAFSRLAECSINLKREFKTSIEIDQFLKQKKKYRYMAEKIFKRCIELDNSNPSHYSSLAYFYYQSANELTIPGGRRDDNLFKLLHNAITYIDMALNMDFKRLNDHYRRGYIFSNLILPKIKYSKFDNSIPQKFNDSKLLLSESIQSFERVISIFESETDQVLKKRFYNTYLKSLYNLADIYENNINIKNEKLYHLVKKIYPEIKPDNFEKWKNYKTKNLLKALEYSEKIIRMINKKFIPVEEEEDINKLLSIEDSLKHESVISTPLKAYQMAKIYFKLYLVESNEIYLEKAKQILLKAINLSKTDTNKYLYIYNLLAQVFILNNKTPLALELLNNLKKSTRIPTYVQMNEAIALIISNELTKAEKILLSIYPVDDNKNKYFKNNEVFYPEIIFWLFIIEKKKNLISIHLYKKMKILKNYEVTKELEEIKHKEEISLKKLRPYLINKPENLYQEIALKIIDFIISQSKNSL